jgi:hypothetical protein
LFRGFWRGHERRRDDILNLCLIQFLKGREEGREYITIFASPKLRDFGEEGREGKLKYN